VLVKVKFWCCRHHGLWGAQAALAAIAALAIAVIAVERRLESREA